jgi:hypothetical protein
MAGTFGQQLEQQNAQQQQGRLTRTQRVLTSQQEANARQKFNALKSEAERLRETEFKGLSFEQYKIKYAQLPPELQQFFLSPSEITAQQEASKVDYKATISQRLDMLRQRMSARQSSYNEYMRRSPNNRSDETERNYEWDIGQLRAEIDYLAGSVNKVDEGYTADDILDYANQKAQYDRDRWENKRSASEQYQKELNAGTLDEAFTKLNLFKTNVSYDQYQQKVEEYNQGVSYTNQLISWGEKEGYKNLPSWAKEKIGYVEPKNETQNLIDIINNPTLAQDVSGRFIVRTEGKTGVLGFVENQYNNINRIASETIGGAVLSFEILNEKRKERLEKNPVAPPMIPLSKIVEPIKVYSGYNSAKSIISDAIKGWNWYENKGYADQETIGKIPIPIFSGIGTTGGEITVGEFHRGLEKSQTELDKKMTELNMPVQETFTQRNQNVFNAMGYGIKSQKEFENAYAKDIEAGTITEEQAVASFTDSDIYKNIIKEYEGTPQALELSKNYQKAINRNTEWKDFMAKYLLTGTKFVYPETTKDFIKSELVVGAVVVGGYGAIQITKAVPSLIWKGISAYNVWKLPSAFNKDLSKEERFLAGVYGTAGLVYLTPKIVGKPFRATWNWLRTRRNFEIFEDDWLYLQRTGRIGTEGFYRNGQYVYQQRGVSGFRANSISAYRGMKPFEFRFTIGKYIPADRLYTQMFESTTKPISKAEYQRRIKDVIKMTKTGRTTGVSASYTNFEDNIKLIERQEGRAGHFRTERELYDMYLSGQFDVLGRKKFVVQRTMWERIFKGKPLARLLKGEGLLLKSTEIRTANLRYAYGGYIGIGENYETQIVTGATTGTLNYATGFRMKDVPSYAKYLKTKQLQALLRKEFSIGRTLIPSAETWTGESVEQQVNIPARYGGAEGVVVTASKGYYAPFKDSYTTWYVTKSVPQLFADILPTGWTATKTSSITGNVPKLTFNNALTQKIWSAFTTEWVNTNLAEISTISYQTAVARKLIAPKPQVKPKVLSFDEIVLNAKRDSVYMNANQIPKNVFVDYTPSIPKSNPQAIKDIIKGITSSRGVRYVSASSVASSKSLMISSLFNYSPSSKVKSPSYSPSYSTSRSISSAIKSLGSMGSSPSISKSPYTYSAVSSPSYSFPRHPSKPKYSTTGQAQSELKKLLKKKLRKTPEIVGLMPDFTARALGLAPKRVKSVKEALKEMNKIQTGFEIRTGATLKPNKLIRNFKI